MAEIEAIAMEVLTKQVRVGGRKTGGMEMISKKERHREASAVFGSVRGICRVKINNRGAGKPRDGRCPDLKTPHSCFIITFFHSCRFQMHANVFNNSLKT